MKSTIASWLLVIGVVVGSLSAAASKKAYRWLELDPGVDQSGEFLYATVEHRRVPGEKPLMLAEVGSPLDPLIVTRLTNSNIRRVKVRHPARDAELVPVAEARGRVLNTWLEIEGQTDSFKDGRVVTSPLVQRAHEAGIAQLEVRNSDHGSAVEPFSTAKPEPPAREGDPYDPKFWEPDERKGWAQPVPLTGPAAKAVEKGWLKLERTIELPRRIAGGTFVDDALAELLQSTGHELVDVKITAPFTWGGWTERWYFLGAVVLIVFAIALKRGASGPSPVVAGATTPAGDVRQALEELLRECEQLGGSAPEMTAEQIHSAIDPIHSGSLYRILDGREAVRDQLGIVGYAHVFGPLASGERMLNRAWSAAVDGYLDEARDCATKAAPHFQEALAAWPKS